MKFISDEEKKTFKEKVDESKESRDQIHLKIICGVKNVKDVKDCGNCTGQKAS